VDFEEYASARGPALLRLALVLTGDHQLAQDLTQSTLLDVFLHWRKVSRAEQPDAYVRRMMVNTYLGWRRRRWFSERPSLTAPPDLPVADHAQHVVDEDACRQALARLSPRARTVLALRYYEDLDDRAIADVLGVGVSSVRSTASRALAALRRDAAPAAPLAPAATTPPGEIP